MVTLTADVTESIKEMTQKLMKTGMYKSQSEVVRDAIRQLAHKYKVDTASSADRAREILDVAAEKSGQSLAKTVRELRDKD
jgi:Arc/MetJ-type ribon-helix-helix transcriptional regulator